MIYAIMIVIAGIGIWLILLATKDDQWPKHKPGRCSEHGTIVPCEICKAIYGKPHND